MHCLTVKGAASLAWSGTETSVNMKVVRPDLRDVAVVNGLGPKVDSKAQGDCNSACNCIILESPMKVNSIQQK